MNNRIKNIIIIILLIVIGTLLWMLYDLNYGRYCKPIIKEVKYPNKIQAEDTAKTINFEAQKSY